MLSLASNENKQGRTNSSLTSLWLTYIVKNSTNIFRQSIFQVTRKYFFFFITFTSFYSLNFCAKITECNKTFDPFKANFMRGENKLIFVKKNYRILAIVFFFWKY